MAFSDLHSGTGTPIPSETGNACTRASCQHHHNVRRAVRLFDAEREVGPCTRSKSCQRIAVAQTTPALRPFGNYSAHFAFCSLRKKQPRRLREGSRVEFNNGDLMPEIVTTPLSYFEVEMEYAEPDIKMWLDRANVVQALYAALKPWSITVDD